MSLFLIHQTPSYSVALTDSLATKSIGDGVGVLGLSASKLAHVGSGIYAAHAGTWQPAWAMLADLHELTASSRRRPSHSALLKKLEQIGRSRHAEYAQLFKQLDLDVRVALILTGDYRAPIDRKNGYTTTLLMWEAARRFSPAHIRGQICFGSNTVLSKFARDTLAHPAMQSVTRASPLAAAQALKAVHSAVAHISNAVSHTPNVLIVSDQEEHSILEGTMLTLPCATFIKG